MTKKSINTLVESMVQDIAIAHGAKIVTKQITVGGKTQDTVEAVGGMFDLDAARGILARQLQDHKEVLTAKLGTATVVA